MVFANTLKILLKLKLLFDSVFKDYYQHTLLISCWY